MFCNEGFNILGCLIVELVKLWMVAAYSKELIDFFVCLVPGLDWVGFDVVGVDGIENHNIVVATVQCDREAASLVGEQLSFDFDHGHEHHVGLVIVGCLFVLDHEIGF